MRSKALGRKAEKKTKKKPYSYPSMNDLTLTSEGVKLVLEENEALMAFARELHAESFNARLKCHRMRVERNKRREAKPKV